MEEEKAHQLYTHLQRFDASARTKKGLGFSSEPKGSGSGEWDKSKMIAFRKEGDPDPGQAAGRGEEWPLSAKLRQNSPHDQSRIRESGGRSPTRSGNSPVSRKSSRKRSTSRSRHSSRHKHRRHRDRSRSSSWGRHRRRHASRSRSRELRKRRREKGSSKESSRRRHSSRHDRSRSRRDDPSEGAKLKDVSVDWSSLPSKESFDYSKKIEGFNTMTSTEKLKAKARYLQEHYDVSDHNAVSVHVAGAECVREPSPTTSNEITNEAPVVLHTKMLTDMRHVEKSHENAIFGPSQSHHPPAAATVEIAPPKGLSNEDATPPAAVEAPLVASEVLASQKTTSWRERAAWLKQRRSSNPG